MLINIMTAVIDGGTDHSCVHFQPSGAFVLLRNFAKKVFIVRVAHLFVNIALVTGHIIEHNGLKAGDKIRAH